MRLRMLKTVSGAENGHTVETFEEGKEYDLGPNLAALFQRDKVAEPVAAAEENARAPKPLADLTKAELMGLAIEELDLNLDPKMKVADMIAAIEDARAARATA